MKKILLMFMVMTLVFTTQSWAKKIEVTTSCYSRVSDSSLDSAGWVKAGTVFEVLEESGAWHFVKFKSDTSHIDETGWVWRQLLDDNKIKGKGANVHEATSTKSPVLFSVKGGAIVELIKKDVKWYKVGPNKHIFHSNIKVLE